MESPLTALELLQAIYCNVDVPLPVRIRAARDCLPFENPKLAVVASVNAPEGLAERLERALAAAQRAQAERSKIIEGRCTEMRPGTEMRPKALAAPPAGSDSREGNAR